jgi:hypothetical protein
MKRDMNDDDQEIAEQLGHEPIAIPVRAVVKGFVVLFAVVIGSLLVIGGLIGILSSWLGGKPTVQAPAIASSEPAGMPALNPEQRGSLRALREQERRVLTEYAWVDAEAGVARIPIRRAIEILSERAQLPAQRGNERANP